jgi:hypothetical protein
MLALETYFRGVLLVPERELFLARLDGHVVGSAHLVRPPRNNEAQATANRAPHPRQKLDSGGFACWQFGHVMRETSQCARWRRSEHG